MSKYGFVYVWFDRKKKRYYVGSHWGTEDDGYVCSSQWMHRARAKRPEDFKRRIVARVYERSELQREEHRWLQMMKPHELARFNTTAKRRETTRYYNLVNEVRNAWHHDPENRKTIGQKISAAKKGKNTGPRPESVGKAISEAKKRKFAERGGMTEEHKAALSRVKKKPHTDEWKAENSKRMKEQWALNTSRRQAVSEAAKKRWEEYRKKKQEQLAG